MFSDTPSGMSSLMSNPRSAMTSFPGSNMVRIKIPQSLVLVSRVGRYCISIDNSIFSLTITASQAQT